MTTVRGPGALHRDGITSADKVSTPGAMTSGATATTGGELPASTTYNMTCAAINGFGATPTPAVVAQATGTAAAATHVVRSTLPSAPTGAVRWALFCGSVTNPLWAAETTEAAVVAAGTNGISVIGVGTAQAGTALGSRVVQFSIAGTAVANNANPYANNNAYCPDNTGPNGTITPIDCKYVKKVLVHVTAVPNNLSALPVVKAIPAFLSQTDSLYKMGDVITVPLLANVGQALAQPFSLDVDGCRGLKILIDEITAPGVGQSVPVTIDVETVASDG